MKTRHIERQTHWRNVGKSMAACAGFGMPSVVLGVVDWRFGVGYILGSAIGHLLATYEYQ
ncbi:MAG: hypothetical protein JNL67_09820 [Planctomycetaceae bacterium]|nr:hypothetical protein [Planctomycetaceae bacterium]